MDAKKRGLGRGLNALFADEEVDAGAAQPQDHGAIAIPGSANSNASGLRRLSVSVSQITPGTLQPRKMFAEDSLNELAESIKTHGVLQPILVRAYKGEEAGADYEIIAGERRWRAAQKAQLHEVPVIILNVGDREFLEIALVENLQREDLNPVDEAMGYQDLMKNHGYTQEKLAEILGKSRPYIANMLRLLGLPDIVLAYLERGEISTGHARALIPMADPVPLAKEIITRKLSVRDVEAIVAGQREQSAAKSSASASKAPKDVDTLALERELSNKLGMKVSIQSRKNGSGKISVAYKSLDQLDEILSKLS